MRIAVGSFVKIITVVGVVGVGLAACSSSPVVNQSSIDELKVENYDPIANAYHIGIGDEVEIKYLFAPELNDRMNVRPDGRISVMFAKDIVAAGKTPQELTDDLKQALAPYVKQLDLVVQLRNFGSQKVFVAGEVAKPGPVQLSTPENLVQVLDEVGWMTPFAGPEKIVLLRRDQHWKQHLYQIDVSKLMTGEDMAQNVMVQAGDVILVSPSDAVITDRWVDQHIRQALPFSTSASAYYNYTPVMQ